MDFSLHQTSFYLFPGHCLLCGGGSQRALDLCPGCEGDLPRSHHACGLCALPLPAPGICGRCQKKPPPFSRITSPLLYRPPVDSLIQQMKYRANLPAGIVLGNLLARHIEQTLCPNTLPDLIVPVPLHWRRRFFRGFNQSRQLANQLSRKLAIPVNSHCIMRIKPTQQQQKLSLRERTRNLQGAFKAKGDLSGRRLALVDDVVTSGATVTLVAGLLRQAGAADVQVWCAARTPLPSVTV